MWKIIDKKIKILKQYDKNYTVFDSSFHKYQFREKKLNLDLLIFETDNNIILPEQLSNFLKYFGDGGAGPDWGMYNLDQFNIYTPNNLNEEDIFNDNVKGFIGIIERYYSYESCIIISGNHSGQIYSFEENSFFFKTHDSLFEFYLEWLDNELFPFEFILHRTILNFSITETIIELFTLKKMQPKTSLKKISSLLGHGVFKNSVNIESVTEYTENNIIGFSLPKDVDFEISYKLKNYYIDSIRLS